jgi:hypothetical protein
VKWDFAGESDEEAVGAGVDVGVGSGDEVIVVSVSAEVVSDAESAVSDSMGASDSTVGAVGDVAAFGGCNIGIARQSTVNMSPGLSSVFGLRT